MKIVGDPYLDRDATIWVNGLRAEKVARVRRLRDGGTTIIETDRGKIVIPAHYEPTLDGEPLLAV